MLGQEYEVTILVSSQVNQKVIAEDIETAIKLAIEATRDSLRPAQFGSTYDITVIAAEEV